MGSGVATAQLMQIVAGAVIPGRPVAKLYVSYTPDDIPCLNWIGTTSLPCGATTLSTILFPLQRISRLANTSKFRLASCFLLKYGVLSLVSRVMSMLQLIVN